MKRGALVVILFLPFAIALSGCGKKSGEGELFSNQVKTSETGTSVETSSPDSSSQASSSSAENVVLKIGPHVFSADDFYAWLVLVNGQVNPMDWSPGFAIDRFKKTFQQEKIDSQESIFESFVQDMLMSIGAVERGYDKYSAVKEMKKMAGLVWARRELEAQEGNLVEVNEDQLRELYDSALGALKKDMDNKDIQFTEFRKTDLGEKIPTLFNLGVGDYLLDWSATFWKIVVNSPAEADRIMARFYEEKSQNNVSAKRAFRTIASEIMGPSNYKEKLSSIDLISKWLQVEDQRLAVGDPNSETAKRLREKAERYRVYLNLLLNATGKEEPIRIELGNKIYLFFLAKDPTYSLVSWEDLPESIKRELMARYAKVKQAEFITKIIDSVKSNYANSIEKHFENL